MREIYFINADSEEMEAGQRETGIELGVDTANSFSSEAWNQSPREWSEETGQQVDTIIRLSPMK